MDRAELRAWIASLNLTGDCQVQEWRLVDPAEVYEAGPINGPLFWAIVWGREEEYMAKCRASWKENDD